MFDLIDEFKPMLAGKAPDDLADLTYPLVASPKLDGIRCVTLNGRAMSRKLKAIPNDHVRTWIEANVPDGVDGELLLQDWTAPFREVSSAVMKKSGEPKVVFAAFDLLDFASKDQPFEQRMEALLELRMEVWDQDPRYPVRFEVVRHVLVESVEDLLDMHQEHQLAGYEGTMVRYPQGPYKYGRSTTREGYLLKIKNFADEEAVVVGFEEQMHNTNAAEKDNLGRTKRSSAKAGKVGKGTLGALVLRFKDGTKFPCGTGFTDLDRQRIWDNQSMQLGAVAKIKHQPDPGGRQEGQKPRFPVFLGWRED